ncbi:Abi family protein [Propionimicrobium lymphophilum]|uniref:Abi family protein n=1 Tax=Propionimicrobium lymphophilum TaxID=33012 RepID=UPI0023F28F2E|nr:Abi family protein [Propionimicrobium lymphophilum]
MQISSTWVQTWLSTPRWNSYLAAANDDATLALDLYEWNLHLAQAIMHDISHIEVGVRNIYDHTLTTYWRGETHWLFDSNSPVVVPLIRSKRGHHIDLNARNRISIAEATRRIRCENPAPGQVIAELPFGFWRHLTDAAHEKTLWVPYLNHAFPKGTDRKLVERRLALMNVVRNRASHHEPLFTPARRKELVKATEAIIDLATLLLPELANHIQHTSTVKETLNNQPHYSLR